MTHEFNEEYAMKKSSHRSHLRQKVGETRYRAPRSGERSYNAVRKSG